MAATPAIHLQWQLHGTWQAYISACSAKAPMPMAQLTDNPRAVTCRRCKHSQQYSKALSSEGGHKPEQARPTTMTFKTLPIGDCFAFQPARVCQGRLLNCRKIAPRGYTVQTTDGGLLISKITHWHTPVYQEGLTGNTLVGTQVL